MANINCIQNNFASGELSPSVWGRSERPFYKSGLEICRNFIPLLTGGLRFRPGTIYSVHSRLNGDVWGVPFRFNIEQAYSLEFTGYKIRIHQNGGVVLETAKAIEGITLASPGVVTITGHGFSTGDEVYFVGVGGMTALNTQFFLVVWIDANTFSLTDNDGNPIDTTLADAWTSGGTVSRVYEIVSPYTAAECSAVKYCGTADLMYIFHPNHEPRQLSRSGSTSWSLGVFNRYSAEWEISAVTNANPGVVTTKTDHGLVAGDRVYIAQVEGMKEINRTEYLVGSASLGAKTFSIQTFAGVDVNTTSYGVFTTGGKVAIIRDNGLVITGITKADPGVITSATHGLSTYDKIYIDSIVGMTELNSGFYWVKKIDANTFSLTNEIGEDIDTSGYTTYASAGKVYLIHGLFTKIGDFPGAGGFYGGRMVTGGSDNDPDVFWQSRGPDSQTGASQYNDFSIGTADTDGMVWVLSSQNFQAHRIYWFSGTPGFMVIGASSGVYKVNGGSDGAAITPSAIFVSPVSSVGVADMMPIMIDNNTYYVEQGRLTLRSFGYSLVDDTYKAYDKNLIADEITSPGITQIAFAKGRPDVIYAVRSDGILLSCTILESDDVAGWTRFPIGGDGVVLSIVTEPRVSGFDRVGIWVERTIDGVTRRYVEYLSEDPRIPDFTDYFTGEDNEAADKLRFGKVVFELQKQFLRLDSALIRDTTQTTTLTLAALTGTDILATSGAAVFTEDSVGEYLYAKFITGEETGIAEIVEYLSSTTVKIDIKEDFLSLSFASEGWYHTDTVITGLGHLEGETLGVLTDGGVHADETVVDGSINLDYPSRYVILGKRYTGIGRSLDIDIPGIADTGLARRKTMEKLFLRLRNTLGGKVGVSVKGLYQVTELMFRRAGQSYYDRPPVIFSGLKQISIKDGYENEKHLYFIQDQPLPMEILASISSLDIGEVE